MSDDEDLFTAAPTTADAEALVSKWLEDSDEESEEAYSTIVASSSTADAPLSRAVGYVFNLFSRRSQALTCSYVPTSLGMFYSPF